MIMFASENRLARVRLGGARQNGHASTRLIGDDLDNPPALFSRETSKLARRPVGIQAVDPVIDQPVHVAPRFGFVNIPFVVQRYDVGGEDAVQALGSWHGESKEGED